MLEVLWAQYLVAWRQCLRARMVGGVLTTGLLVMALAALMASFSLRQPLVMAFDIGFSGIRILGALLAVFWVQDLYFRDIEKKLVLSTFAYPVSKSSYVLGRFFGLLAILALSVLLWAVGLYLLGLFADWGYQASSAPVFGWPFLVLMAGLLVDLAVIAAFTLLIVSAAETAFVPLFTGLGFAIAARSLGTIIGYLELSLDADEVLRAQLLPWLHAARWLLPDLGSLDVRAATLYGQVVDWAGMGRALLGCAGYILILLVLAVRNYERREWT